MNSQDLIRWGIPPGDLHRQAFRIIKRLINEQVPPETVRSQILDVTRDPAAFMNHPHWGTLATALETELDPVRERPVPWKQWGTDLEPEAIRQLENACRLPVATRGALMPDAHVGYGLPIGGVLATDRAVIPYAVGVDIACRMKMTVLDLPLKHFEKTRKRERLARAIEEETRFGVGAHFKTQREHPVMDADWSCTPVTRSIRDKAWSQLGTSGSGNHFVEFGRFQLFAPLNGLPEGEYIALLSHSGSRGAGAAVAAHYSKLARNQHPNLPKELTHLAWLSLDSESGLQYWHAMNLMGDYAAANHACIHKAVAENLGAEVLFEVENHHNFAWKEIHDEREVIVHRKGATPAGPGVLGVIPGSMADPGFLVRGKGNPASMHSASHGAGRLMSRTRAREHLRWQDAEKRLKDAGITLLSAGLDEVPMVYKNIRKVMEAQEDLVEILGQFDPKLVKMAPAGEKPED